MKPLRYFLNDMMLILLLIPFISCAKSGSGGPSNAGYSHNGRCGSVTRQATINKNQNSSSSSFGRVTSCDGEKLYTSDLKFRDKKDEIRAQQESPSVKPDENLFIDPIEPVK